MKQKSFKYSAVGFVEALIAIAVAGVASVALLSVAINTISQVVRNEQSDRMTELAIEGAAMVKKIADNQNSSEDNLFPGISYENSCFAFSGNSSEPSFLYNGENFDTSCSYNTDRKSCKAFVTTSDEKVFRIFCMLTESDTTRDLIVGKVVTGLVDCDEGDIRSGSICEIPDYEYFLGVKVNQPE